MPVDLNGGVAMHSSALKVQFLRSRWPQGCALLFLAILVLVDSAVAQESTLHVASVVKGKARPTELAVGVVGFDGPAGDGRWGANGLYIPPDRVSAGNVTEMSFTHSRSGHARGVQVVHPVKKGHVLISILRDHVNILAGGNWPGYSGRKSSLTEHSDAYNETFPLDEGQTISVRTRAFPSGFVEVTVDGKVVATALVDEPTAFGLSDGFKLFDGSKPEEFSVQQAWPAGSAGIIIGPLDRGQNVAEKIVFKGLDISDDVGAAAVVKMEKKTDAKPSASPLPKDAAAETTAVGSSVTLDMPEKQVLSVWGIHDEKGTYRVQLFFDGTTNQGFDWKPVSQTKIEIRDGTADLVDGGFSLLGSWKSGAIIDGRLLMQRCWVAGTTDPIVDIKPISELDSTDRTFQENLTGDWQLTASNRRKKTNVSLPVTFSADHRVVEAGRTIATWRTERTRIEIQFLDPSIGATTLSPRNKDQLSGQAKSPANDVWSVRFDRVKILSTWDTDQIGTVVLFSNGRVSDPLGADGHGFWWKDGKNMRFSRYSVSHSVDLRSFTGRDHYGTGIKGTLLAVPQP